MQGVERVLVVHRERWRDRYEGKWGVGEWKRERWKKHLRETEEK